ncbi:MAG TPA: SMP-30/gluconolactonase/LRE family protein [Mycobacteriales bacterium]|nr:SMP-30/gluconolactonase/LRE family protein [Mycobacteriales bacterium]
MTDSSSHLVLEGFAFLEAPRWHRERLWFSDFYGHRVYSALENGSDLRVEAEVPGQPSGLGWLPDGRLLVVSMRDRQILRREHSGELVTHADLSDYAAGHLNDMVVDRHGRAYVGNFGFDLMARTPLEPASIHRVDPDGSVTEAAGELWFPNGAVLTPDGVLVVNETFGNRVTAFDVAPDGSLVNRRLWAEFAPLPTSRWLAEMTAQTVVAPDGSCLDAQGGLWIADAVGARLLRVVEGGEVTDEVRTESNVYACALGGVDGRTLFACVAPDFFEKARSEAREASMVAFTVAVPAAEGPS